MKKYIILFIVLLPFASFSQKTEPNFVYITNYNINNCPSSGGGNKSSGLKSANNFDIKNIEKAVEELDAEITNNQDLLKQLVDNGNTDILLSQTETANNNNFAQVSEKIEHTKGYISDKVASEYLNAEGNEFIKTQSLINISPLPSQAKTKLEKTDINPTLKYIIEQYQEGVNIREQKEMMIAGKIHKRQMLIRDAIRETLNDSVAETDELIKFLETRPEINNRYTLTGLLIANGKYSEAEAELNNLEMLKTDFYEEKQEEIETFINLQKIVIKLMQSEDTMFNTIVSENIDFLNNLAADSNCVLQSTAWGMLAQADKGEFLELTRLPEISTKKRGEVKPVSVLYDKSQHNGIEPLINIYPNPADDHITVEYAMLDKGDNVSVSIYDMQGKLIKTVKSDNQIDVLNINISDLQRGTYNVKFVSAMQGHYTVKITKK